MKKRTVEFSCDEASAAALSIAVTAYADAAYPPGGSECTQVARETLLDAAKHCAAHPGGVLSLRKRLLPMIRAAVKWSLSEDSPVQITLNPDVQSLMTRR